MIRKLVTNKNEIWQEDKEACVDYLTDISQYFAGNLNWDKGQPDQSYADWFKDLADQIE